MTDRKLADHPGTVEREGGAWTPGPWRVQWSSPSPTIRGADNDPICGIAHRLLERLRGVEEANSHLIAAAPDLADALTSLVQPDLAYDGSNIIIRCSSHSEAMEIVRTARAALAKARGEQTPTGQKD